MTWWPKLTNNVLDEDDYDFDNDDDDDEVKQEISSNIFNIRLSHILGLLSCILR